MTGGSAGHAAETLEGHAAWQALVGNTVVTTAPGGDRTDYFAPDGTIRHVDQDGATGGHWTLEGDTICLDFPEDDERTCVKPTVTGDAGTFRDPDGAEDRFTVLPGNARNL